MQVGTPQVQARTAFEDAEAAAFAYYGLTPRIRWVRLAEPRVDLRVLEVGDLALVLGMLSHIVTRRLYDEAFVRNWVVGFDELARHLETNGFTPENRLEKLRTGCERDILSLNL